MHLGGSANLTDMNLSKLTSDCGFVLKVCNKKTFFLQCGFSQSCNKGVCGLLQDK